MPVFQFARSSGGPIMKKTSRLVAALVAASVSYAGFLQSAQAALIGTEQVAVAERVPGVGDARAQVHATLARADVARALAERGVDPAQVRARVDALSDAVVAQLQHTIDSAPAGASDVLGVIVFIFVLLLVTDILGLTKVFPFTRSVR
jgi:VIT1/CCC1 family predicted Fe2+/Mn2+ transporter